MSLVLILMYCSNEPFKYQTRGSLSAERYEEDMVREPLRS